MTSRKSQKRTHAAEGESKGLCGQNTRSAVPVLTPAHLACLTDPDLEDIDIDLPIESALLPHISSWEDNEAIL
ncbi:MAG: hypothetical protein JO270_15235 [Acidobacteriaceae bacterium]|nr:hypothetical protein [Acidobacteriaceae bacterium]MBV8570212.1 hypothetical protein [Acidobacteriaceae bacterium]